MNTDKVAGGDKTTNGGDGNLTNMIGKLLLEVREEGKREREKNQEINNKTFELLAEKFENLQMAQIKSLEAQRLSLKVPFPKYNGKAGEFDEWKAGVLSCIKYNNWTDHKRVLEMLPSALSGQASRIYSTLTSSQKQTLETVFAALKESLEPEGKQLNRELFLKAKRSTGESMRAFVSRCGVYVTRADEIENVEDSAWATPFIIEKNLLKFGNK